MKNAEEFIMVKFMTVNSKPPASPFQRGTLAACW